MSSAPPPRLYCIVAREAPIAVVFRRGPSKWWHIMKWDLATDAIEHGAWIKARLYPRRSGVSPDGRLLCYFAIQSADEPGSGWEKCCAVAKVPWVTALCAWRIPATFDLGCVFRDESRLAISGVESLDPFYGEFSGRLSMWSPRDVAGLFTNEISNGWEWSGGLRIRFESDLRLLLRISDRECKWAIQRRSHNSGHTLMGFDLGSDFTGHAVEGRYVAFALETADGSVHGLPDVVWADWDHHGRLLVATDDGFLQVRDPRQGPEAVTWQHDLRDLAPDPQPAPEWAREW